MESEQPGDDLLRKTSDASTPIAAFAFGAFVACAGIFPVAAVVALLYRFPVPFGGYVSGFDAAGDALLATLFYGIFGGFVLLALLGGVAGLAAHSLVGPRWPRVRRFTIGIILVVDAGAALLLATLDKLIGPW